MQRVLHQSDASHLTSLHLLRALLREASYLPDAHARTYFRRYIVNRFRAYQPKQNANNTIDARAVEKYRHRSFRRRHEAIINERTREMQRRGQRGLNYLRRAVLGEVPCLYKVLMFTYGRMGRRKYFLLDDLLRVDENATKDTGPAPLQKLYHDKRRSLVFFDAPTTKGADHIIAISKQRYSRLEAVVSSQCQRAIGLNGIIRKPHLKTPIKNIWQRPMPIKRARNNVTRWYAETMTRLLPPLPSEEWDSIQAMAGGTNRISFARPRTPAVKLVSDPMSFEAQFSKRLDEALALNKPSKADQLVDTNRRSAINARQMRRIYSKILVYCSKLDWDEERNKWKVSWGKGLSRINQRIYSMPVDDALFSNVDEEGKLIREKRPGEKPSEKKPRRKHVLIPFYLDYLPESHPLRVEAEKFRSKARDDAADRERQSASAPSPD
jgi:hypothetical protein